MFGKWIKPTFTEFSYKCWVTFTSEAFLRGVVGMADGFILARIRDAHINFFMSKMILEDQNTIHL